MCYALEKFNVNAKIKWPNDLRIRGKKLAGILAEGVQIPSGFCMLIGIGVNIGISKSELAHIEIPTTSVLEEIRINHPQALPPSPKSVLIEFLNHWNKLYTKHQESGFPGLYSQWLNYTEFSNETIKINNAPRTGLAQVQGLNSDGTLQVKWPDGTCEKLLNGDVSRPDEIVPHS